MDLMRSLGCGHVDTATLVSVSQTERQRQGVKAKERCGVCLSEAEEEKAKQGTGECGSDRVE